MNRGFDFSPQSNTPVWSNFFRSGKGATVSLEPETQLEKKATTACAPSRSTQRALSFPSSGPGRATATRQSPTRLIGVPERDLNRSPRHDGDSTTLRAACQPQQPRAHFPSQAPIDPDVFGPRRWGLGGKAPPPEAQKANRSEPRRSLWSPARGGFCCYGNGRLVAAPQQRTGLLARALCLEEWGPCLKRE